ncbi:MAG: hypothetical protein GXC72_06335 [Chitinophagaceae bacterium]|nr:hypothetical protein [Chitinophagaceae bacterium]
MNPMHVPIPWYESAYWSSFWGQFWVGTIGGIFSAFLFLLIVLYVFKPAINIAPFLCKVGSQTQSYYIFKFVNKSYFAAHEIEVRLYKIRKIPMGSGRYNNEHEPLTIKNGDISHIPERPFWWWQRRIDHPYCVIVRSFDNLNEILADDMNAILLRVSLKHGLTGLSAVVEQEYGNVGDIRMGKFKPGPIFDNI